MAFRQFETEELGTITVYKRRGARSLRLTIRADGSLRVTIPTWTPYASGVSFALSRASWIKQHAKPPAEIFTEGQLIGKGHRLRFVSSAGTTKASSRVRQIQIVITHPPSLDTASPGVQKIAATASIRALRLQAERLLPIRVSELAQKHGFIYRSVTIKNLKTRWGSCDQSQNITLNLFLMQLPWELIDYVLLHELTHTIVMKHGPEFWQAMERIDPQTQSKRKLIKAYRPAIQAIRHDPTS